MKDLYPSSKVLSKQESWKAGRSVEMRVLGMRDFTTPSVEYQAYPLGPDLILLATELYGRILIRGPSHFRHIDFDTIAASAPQSEQFQEVISIVNTAQNREVQSRILLPQPIFVKGTRYFHGGMIEGLRSLVPNGLDGHQMFEFVIAHPFQELGAGIDDPTIRALESMRQYIEMVHGLLIKAFPRQSLGATGIVLTIVTPNRYSYVLQLAPNARGQLMNRGLMIPPGIVPRPRPRIIN